VPIEDTVGALANLAQVERLRPIAGELGCTVAQLAVAGVSSRGDDIVSLVGTKARARWTEAIGALDVTLDAATLERLEEAVPRDAVAGERYAPPQVAHLGSER
jgi:aryl-alcohol dehydrogenase-like predicted oxidoreductase